MPHGAEGAVKVSLFLRALDDDVKDIATQEAVMAHFTEEGCNGGSYLGEKDAAGSPSVTLEAYSNFNAFRAAHLAGCDDENAKVMLERATTTLAMAAEIAPEQRVLVDASPVELFKAKKNDVERRLASRGQAERTRRRSSRTSRGSSAHCFRGWWSQRRRGRTRSVRAARAWMGGWVIPLPPSPPLELTPL